MAFNSTFAKTIVDRVLLWIHGRRLGLFGDGQGTNNNSLVLDGVAIGSTRTGAAPLIISATGLAAAGAITTTGTLVGDNVAFVMGPTNADATSSFESTVSVAGQVQQTSASNLSGNQYVIFVNPQAAA
jgi:hypothetical protein